jgi:hypothetical protein
MLERFWVRLLVRCEGCDGKAPVLSSVPQFPRGVRWTTVPTQSQSFQAAKKEYYKVPKQMA